MNRPELDFRKLTLLERLLRNGFAALLRLGLGLDHNYLLEVRGCKTDRVSSTPVNLQGVQREALPGCSSRSNEQLMNEAVQRVTDLLKFRDFRVCC